MITAQYAKGGRYIYYRCSKKHGKCNQPYLNSKSLVHQLKDELDAVSLPDDWAEIMLAEIEAMERKEVLEQRSFSQNIEQQVLGLDQKTDKLINSFLDGLIEKEAYIKKKDELLKQKVDLQERQRDFWGKGVAWVELTREWVEQAHQAGKLAISDDFFEIKQFVKKIGSNRRVMDKKVQLDVVPPFSFVSAYRRRRGISGDGALIGGGKKEKDTNPKMEDVLSCRGTRIRTWDLVVPNDARYRTALHPVN
jgi:hypothetical protein